MKDTLKLVLILVGFVAAFMAGLFTGFEVVEDHFETSALIEK